MAWFKVDDKLHDHPKAWRAGVPAMGLWSLAGSWSADNLSDGFVPEYVAARWDRSYRRLAARLVDAGFWDPAEREGVSGWQFHDWNAPGMQPTSEQVKARRAEAAERQRRAREAARARRDAERTNNDVTQMSQRDSRRDSRTGHSVSHGPPDPTRPDPTREVLSPTAADGADAPSPGTAGDLLAEWIEHCTGGRPPRRVVGQVATELAAMLDEGIPPDDLRRGLAAWHAKGLHPSTLPSVVHETRTHGDRRRPTTSTTDDRVAAGLALAARLTTADPPAIGA